jgi:hypothetical protein
VPRAKTSNRFGPVDAAAGPELIVLQAGSVESVRDAATLAAFLHSSNR